MNLGLTRYLVKGEASYNDLVGTVEELISQTISRAKTAPIEKNSNLLRIKTPLEAKCS